MEITRICNNPFDELNFLDFFFVKIFFLIGLWILFLQFLKKSQVWDLRQYS